MIGHSYSGCAINDLATGYVDRKYIGVYVDDICSNLLTPTTDILVSTFSVVSIIPSLPAPALIDLLPLV